MPPAPELLQAARQIGLPEIDHEMEAHQLRRAARDVAVTAEVAVNLPCEGICAEGQHRQPRLSELAAERGIGDQPAVVRHHAFPEKTGQDEHHSTEKLLAIINSWLLNLRQQMRWPLNGTRDEVRKQRNEQRIVHQPLGRFQLPVIDVHNVRNFLEGVKRDSRRQNDPQYQEGNVVDSHSVQHLHQRIFEEVEVFEEAQKREV